MTALPEYQLLEAPGLYAERPGLAPQEVLLCFGAASLTILRFDETPLAHWPLATLSAVGCDGDAVILAPDPHAPERLSVSEPEMIAALRAVSGAFEPRETGAPRRRRGRRLAISAALAAAVGAGLWSAGPTLRERAAQAAPAPLRAALGEAAVAAYAGDGPCAPGALARREMEALARRLDRAAPAPVPHALRLVAVAGPALAVPAPGGRIALSAPRLADVEAPRAVVAALARAAARAEGDPPLAAALRALAAGDALDDLATLAVALATGAPPGAPNLARTAAAAMAKPEVADARLNARAAEISRKMEEGGPALDREGLALIRSACASR
ncbi:MAG: hypothetical protein ACFCUS_00200 [Rubrimonas sp.]|uniref:hypothetical protein n=1 Tax=Rubrimonas sp. TaxID=2036015 RepID=UPI002FDC7EC8